jgi:N-acetylglutamate synthase
MTRIQNANVSKPRPQRGFFFGPNSSPRRASMNDAPRDPSPPHAGAVRRRAGIDVLGLEERGFSAWPAPQNVYFGGWVFRIGGGFTKRANSANALGDRQDFRSDSINAWTPLRDFGQVRAEAERLYESKGLPTIFRLTPLAGADADFALAEAGYRALDPSSVMTATLDAARPDANVKIEEGPSPRWLNGVTSANGVAPSHRAIHDSIVRSIALPVACATWVVDGRAVGYGLGVVDRGAIGLFDIVVAPPARGRGGGRLLTQALMAWGKQQGATGAYLQVIDANIIARRLYESLGFEVAYGYHYRRREFGAQTPAAAGGTP